MPRVRAQQVSPEAIPILPLQGGKFGPGFLSAGFAKAVTTYLPFDKLGLDGIGDKYDGWEYVAGRTTVAAISGGTASVIGGGKFENGAKTAALAHLLNFETGRVQQKTHTTLKLRRFQESSDSTIGELTIDGIKGKWYVLEPGGPDSTVEGSGLRISEGKYQLKPYSSQKYPNAYQLVDVSGRTEILIHRGNFHTDTAGCLCPGTSYGSDSAENFRTFSSRAARDQIFSIIKASDSASIIITNDF